eukprot:130299-Pelagomonas_calceolata.AAC.2
MKHQPAPGWLYSFMLAAYRQLDMFDAMQLGIVFEALPRVSPHPSWLDEVGVASVGLCLGCLLASAVNNGCMLLATRCALASAMSNT